MPQFEIVYMVLQNLKDSRTSECISVWFPERQAENISLFGGRDWKPNDSFTAALLNLWESLQGQSQTTSQVMPLDHPRMKEMTLAFTKLCSSENPEQGTVSVSGWAQVKKWLKELLPNRAKQLKDLPVCSRLHHCKGKRKNCVSFITSVITLGIWDWNIST